MIAFLLLIALQSAGDKPDQPSVEPFPDVVSAARGVVPKPKIVGGVPPYRVRYRISGREVRGGEAVNSPTSAAMRQVIGASGSRSRGRIRERQEEFAVEFKKLAGRSPIGKVIDGYLEIDVTDARRQRAFHSQIVYFEVSDQAFEAVVSKWEADLKADHERKSAEAKKQAAKREAQAEKVRIRRQEAASRIKAEKLREQTKKIVKVDPKGRGVLVGLWFTRIFVIPLVFIVYRWGDPLFVRWVREEDLDDCKEFTNVRMLITSILGAQAAGAVASPAFVYGQCMAFEILGLGTPTAVRVFGVLSAVLACVIVAPMAVRLTSGQRKSGVWVYSGVMLGVFAFFPAIVGLVVLYVLST